MPGAAAVRDDRSRLDGLPDTCGEGRVVAVGRGEPAAVVDDHEVPVAAEPARVDHRAGSGCAHRGPRGHCDVDALVHPAPAHPEPTRHRAAHGPRQRPATGGNGHFTGGRLACSDRGGEGRTLLLELGDLRRAPHRGRLRSPRGWSGDLPGPRRAHRGLLPPGRPAPAARRRVDRRPTRARRPPLRASWVRRRAWQDVIAGGRRPGSRCARPAHRSC